MAKPRSSNAHEDLVKRSIFTISMRLKVVALPLIGLTIIKTERVFGFVTFSISLLYHYNTYHHVY